MRKNERKGRSLRRDEERGGHGRSELRESSAAGSRGTAVDVDAWQGAVFRDAATRRRRRRAAREDGGGERERGRTGSPSTKVRRDERQKWPCAGRSAADSRTEPAKTSRFAQDCDPEGVLVYAERSHGRARRPPLAGEYGCGGAAHTLTSRQIWSNETKTAISLLKPRYGQWNRPFIVSLAGKLGIFQKSTIPCVWTRIERNQVRTSQL